MMTVVFFFGSLIGNQKLYEKYTTILKCYTGF
jgi:hypothetical protein